MAVPFCCSS